MLAKEILKNIYLFMWYAISTTGRWAHLHQPGPTHWPYIRINVTPLS
jgi:hypothetical protein